MDGNIIVEGVLGLEETTTNSSEINSSSNSISKTIEYTTTTVDLPQANETNYNPIFLFGVVLLCIVMLLLVRRYSQTD